MVWIIKRTKSLTNWIIKRSSHKKKVEKKKNELRDLSSKFKELKSLIYNYRDKKEEEIQELKNNHQKFNDEIEVNQKKYEKLIDEAADEISSFVEKARQDNKSQ